MHTLSAFELRKRFLSGEVSAKEITLHFLHQISQLEPQIQAFLTIFEERALKKAEELDLKRQQGKPVGLLSAIPVAIKDNIHIEGELTTCASKFLENYRAPFSATCVELLEAEDAIILGKTNLDEFAMGSSVENSAFKQSFNPWNTKCVPGGSSGGSAAAVAARMCPISLGSDTGGSIRQPAAFCGTYGFKPTYGSVSRYGLVAFGSSLDQIGPFANSVLDIALTMEVIDKHCPMDATSSMEPRQSYLEKIEQPLSATKIGIPFSFLKDLPKDLYEIFEQGVERLKDLGMEVVEIDLDILKHSISTYYILATAEASTNLARFDGVRYGKRSQKAKTIDEVYDLSKEEGFGPEVKRRILLGTFVLSSGYQDAYYVKAQKVRTLIIQKIQHAFSQCDAIVMPTTPVTAFEKGAVKDPLQMYLMDTYSICSNLAGLPAINVPVSLDSDNKPFGLQIMGPQKSDAFVCQMAYAFEKHEKTQSFVPPIVEAQTC
jgi:aspartyl-tRNA(Asn)/glutamyl-tRNA(Gln) amidotransferase subunit A